MTADVSAKLRVLLEWYWEHPVEFVRTVFGAEPDEWQAQGLRDFVSDAPDTTRLAYQACVGVGKDALLAWSGWLFLACCGGVGQHPQGACIAPTGDQLRDTLWKEYARWYNQPSAALLRELFEMTAERIFAKAHPLTWFITARGYPKNADTETIGRTLSGLHAPYMLIQLTESATIPAAMTRTAEQARAGAKWWKVQQAGNPIARDGCLGVAAIDEPDRWRLTVVTGDPDDPKRSSRIPIEMAREEIANKGRSDPWVMAHILGQFPPGGLNTLIEPHEVDAAMERAPREPEFDWAAKVIGVDVGRMGLDPSVVACRQGKMMWQLWEKHGIDGVALAGHVATIWRDWGAQACFVDETGVGASPLDQLVALNYSPVGVAFAGEPRDRRYLNKRAEMIQAFVDWIKAGGALPRDATLKKELCALRYGYKGDRKKIEEKDEIRKRLGHSTDRVDACALTFAVPVAPTGGPLAETLALMGHRPQVAVTDEYEPPQYVRPYA